MNPELTNEDLARITAKQVQNLTAKLKSGKPLTRPEMAQLEELRQDGVDMPDVKTDYPEHTKSDKVMRETIRRKVGISERQAYDWIKKLRAHKSNTKGWHVPEILAMVLERQKAAVTGPNADLQRELLQEKVWIHRNRRKQGEGKLVVRSEIMENFRRTMQSYRSAIESWRAHNTAKLPELAEAVDALADDLIDRIRATADEPQTTGE